MESPTERVAKKIAKILFYESEFTVDEIIEVGLYLSGNLVEELIEEFPDPSAPIRVNAIFRDSNFFIGDFSNNG